MTGFVLLNYIAYEETINCINSILDIDGQKIIVVVDNGSNNDSFEILKLKYINIPEIIIIKNENNDGFAKGNNIGYRFLRENYNCDFIVVMNNDMIIEQKKFIPTIHKIFEESHFDVLGPDIFSIRDKRHQNPQSLKNYTYSDLIKMKRILLLKNKLSFLYYFAYLKKKIFHKKSKIKFDSDFKVEQKNVVMHGSCYIFSKKFIKNEHECFYNKTFMYFESYILHFICMKKNYLMLYSPKLKILHYEDVTTDMVYKKSYQKAIFCNKCMLDSCNIYIDLIKRWGDK